MLFEVNTIACVLCVTLFVSSLSR